MTTRESTLCLCGCQELCTPGKVWRKGHHFRIRPAITPRSLTERFWEKVQRTETCWLWTGGTSGGYGVIASPGDMHLVRAHRVSYELHYGPIPDGLWVLHHCDNRGCTRPDHLFLGTARDNTQDMLRKRRHSAVTHPERFARGDRNGSRLHPEKILKGMQKVEARLTDDNIRTIRRLYNPPYIRQIDLARMFGVCKSSISQILLRKTWKHVED